MIQAEVYDAIKSLEPSDAGTVFKLVVHRLRGRMSRGPSGDPVPLPSLDEVESRTTPELRTLSDMVAGKMKVSFLVSDKHASAHLLVL